MKNYNLANLCPLSGVHSESMETEKLQTDIKKKKKQFEWVCAAKSNKEQENGKQR